MTHSLGTSLCHGCSPKKKKKKKEKEKEKEEKEEKEKEKKRKRKRKKKKRKEGRKKRQGNPTVPNYNRFPHYVCGSSDLIPDLAQWVKDPVLLQLLWLRFDPWPRKLYLYPSFQNSEWQAQNI